MAAAPQIPPMPGQATDPSVLMGPASPSAQPEQASGEISDAVRAASRQVMDMQTQIEALARTYPETAAEARKAVEAVKSMLVKIVTNKKAPEPRAPNILG